MYTTNKSNAATQETLKHKTYKTRKEIRGTDYNFIVSSRCLYSSLVLIWGLRSLICKASSVNRKSSPRDVIWRIST